MKPSSCSTSSAAARAFVIFREIPGTREERLGRILTFFGVPWQFVSLATLESGLPAESACPYAVLGSAEDVAEALALPYAAVVVGRAAALYAYASVDREPSRRAVSSLTGGEWIWVPPQGGPVSVEITDRCGDLTGPMSGLRVSLELGPDEWVLAPLNAAANRPSDDGKAPDERFTPILSVNGLRAFFRVLYNGASMYVCASAAMVDIDAPVGRNYYDVKADFLSAVPLVMFITWVFRDVMWRPNELGACLIIDDPLLKSRYGFCDFPRLRDLMRQHRFTTNIAFIPWNWRRTTRRASAFFRRESHLFSVSVHGCDHVAAEFGETSLDLIDRRARLAQSRMRKHQARTNIQHDPIMVFPQGVFSSTCPGVLKQNGFVAAVNTEVSPVDNTGPKTLVRDVWDVAILRYGSFAIYTRRYQHHGLENFAFDLLLGKPCFIVAHHGCFRDGGAALVTLVDKLRALNCDLRWRSPREVIRRAYRKRVNDEGMTQVHMYGAEMLLTNSRGRVENIAVHKAESALSIVAEITQDGHAIEWSHTPEGLSFRCPVPPRGETLAKVGYHGNAVGRRTSLSVKYELSVAARRIFSELRDEYVQTLSPRHAESPVVQSNREGETPGAANV